MDSAMRDLEQIREREDEGGGRPLALVALLIGVTVALVFAMGSVVGWSSEEQVAEDDPLARLDRAAGLGAHVIFVSFHPLTLRSVLNSAAPRQRHRPCRARHLRWR